MDENLTHLRAFAAAGMLMLLARNSSVARKLLD